MLSSFSAFIKKWMLVLSMFLGVGIYLCLYYVPGLEQVEICYSNIAKELQPFLVGIMLFLQFNVTAPKDLHLHRWHAQVLGLQALLFALFAFVTISLPQGNLRILSECVMLCFICPTASAAGVITMRIGGSLKQTMAYLLLCDVMSTLLIPLVVPFVNPQEDLTYFQLLWSVAKRVFSMLILPCGVAWLIRYTLPKVQERIAGFVNYAFYLWGITLTLAMSLATRSFVHSHSPVWLALLIALVVVFCCMTQFMLGSLVAKRYGVSIARTAGQTFGQKNTGFLIWLGIYYMTPITSVAGGLYAICQNIINSWELQHYAGGSAVRNKS